MKDLQQFRDFVLTAASDARLVTDRRVTEKGELRSPSEEELAVGGVQEVAATYTSGESRSATSDKRQAELKRVLACQDVFHSTIYLSLSDSTRVAVAELLALCVELEVYSCSSEGGLVELVQRCVSAMDGPRLREALAGTEWGVRVNCWRALVNRLEGTYVYMYVCAYTYITAIAQSLLSDSVMNVSELGRVGGWEGGRAGGEGRGGGRRVGEREGDRGSGQSVCFMHMCISKMCSVLDTLLSTHPLRGSGCGWGLCAGVGGERS